jgi:hypothetical protein
VLGASYLPELLEQVPKENLPSVLGGECECDEGCALSDMGPWQDPQWVKTPKWAKKGDLAQDVTIQDESSKEGIQEAAKNTSDATKATDEEADHLETEKAPAAVA